FDNSIVVGWNIVKERREIIRESELVFNDSSFSNTSSSERSNVGVGGSLARFQIVQDYLYTVGSYTMSIFNISQLSAPVLETVQPSGWNIETMFYAEGYLSLGGTNGMYIYSMENPSSPSYVPELVHCEGWDPVVVDGDYAYLSVRGGRACGQC